MPRTKISEFSATPADNTDIDNINIAEGCAPSGINNAIRELMSQLKEMQTGASGDTFTFTTLLDGFGNVRDIPRTGSAKTSSYTLLATDIGQFVEIGSGGSVTIPDAIFAAGDAVSLFNNTSGNITITCTITTAYVAGIDADKATVTLATRGVCTILFISGTVCVLSGNVS